MNNRRRFLTSGGMPTVGNVADAVFYDSNSDSFVMMRPDEITSVIDGYTPIGVVVIPASHDVYGDGTCGVISLAEMNRTTPDTGSSDYKSNYWGGLNIDISLTNYSAVNYIGTGSTLNNGVVQGAHSAAYLPSDRFSNVTGLDGISNYYNTDSSCRQAPSPYNADGSRNEAYYTTAYSTANALSDFDGVGNTKVLTDLATAQSDWKTASTITHSSDAGYYPAACCCWRFHTEGTEQGQWYLPAMGELGYVINRISAINTTINNIKSVYSSVVAVALYTANSWWYLSSSEYDTDYARFLVPGSGYVGYNGKGFTYYVRAFLRV